MMSDNDHMSKMTCVRLKPLYTGHKAHSTTVDQPVTKWKSEGPNFQAFGTKN